MFGRYCLPGDDVAPTSTVVAATFGSPSDAEDAEYPASNLIAESPSRPAKLTTTSGYWDLTFAAPVTIVGAAVIYHNLDAGIDVTIEDGGIGSPSFSIPIPIPTHHEDGWPVSPWVLFDTPETTDVVRLSINGVNSLPVMVGRLLLLTAIRDLTNDVRWGVEEIEEHGLIEHATDLGVETIYALGGKRRRFSGEFALLNTTAANLISLHRSAQGRVLPWLLIPDVDVNDAWLVRFEENRWSRVREMPNHNIFPFRVQELSRGLPWP